MRWSQLYGALASGTISGIDRMVPDANVAIVVAIVDRGAQFQSTNQKKELILRSNKKPIMPNSLCDKTLLLIFPPNNFSSCVPGFRRFRLIKSDFPRRNCENCRQNHEYLSTHSSQCCHKQTRVTEKFTMGPSTRAGRNELEST